MVKYQCSGFASFWLNPGPRYRGPDPVHDPDADHGPQKLDFLGVGEYNCAYT
jgi:hypothetical protein